MCYRCNMKTPHKTTVIKKARDLFMRIENADQSYHCHMTNPDLPEITEGRVGLRHMFTRSARYRNFRISTAIGNKYAGHEALVQQTHAASLKVRERLDLRRQPEGLCRCEVPRRRIRVG